MNFQFYLEKLQDSKIFQDFIKKNPDAFPCSAFFVIDKIGSDNKQHFDFYVPSMKKMFSFALEAGVQIIPIETFNKNDLNAISLEHDFDFDDVQEVIENEKNEQGISKKIQKILISMQNLNGKDFLVGTIFVSSLGMIKVTIDIKEMKIIDFEKKSFFDIMNVFKK